MTPLPTDAAAHVFVADLDHPKLSSEDRHHLERVLRLRPGTEITVSDGAGGWRAMRFGVVHDASEPLGPIVREPSPVPEIAVAFALLKGERPELVVQKLTELGVDRIVPMTTDRCVVRWDSERAARHEARLRRVAREAGMQCRRVHLPVVESLASFAAVAARAGAVIADGDGGAPGLDCPLVLVGPEGGWSPAESAALAHVALGPHVLRAETAAIAAGALLAARRHALL